VLLKQRFFFGAETFDFGVSVYSDRATHGIYLLEFALAVGS
jgi:hypothetical protein